MESTESTESPCTFCSMRYADIIDPRKLPCAHVACSACIEACMSSSEQERVSCPQCNQTYSKSDLEKVTGGSVSKLTCDSFDCTNGEAVKYCVACSIKFCSKHLQGHQAIFGPAHEVISIEVYEKSPEKYKKLFCEQHSKEMVIKACSRCLRLICNMCDRTEGVCKGNDHHEYVSVKEIVEKLTSGLKELLESADAMRVQISKAEKDAWHNLDSVEERCKKWMEEIDRVKDEQIKQITEAAAALKSKVHQHLQKTVDGTERFTADRQAAADSLENSRLQVRKLLEEGRMMTSMEKTRQMREDLKASLDLKLARYGPADTVTLLVESMPTSFNAKLLQLPSSLQLTSKHTTPGWCFTSCYASDSKILVGGNDGLAILDNATKQMSQYDAPYKQVYSAITLGHLAYILHEENSICKLERSLSNLKLAETLLEFENESSYAPFMAVSDTYVVIYDAGSDKIIIYNLLTRQKTIISNVPVHRPYLLSSNQLLAAGSNQLVKYVIDEGQLRKVWICQGLKNISTVCADADGLIFTSTRSNLHTVYLISPDGMLLKKLQNENLPAEYTGQISVRGDELVVPGLSDRNLYLFKFNY